MQYSLPTGITNYGIVQAVCDGCQEMPGAIRTLNSHLWQFNTTKYRYNAYLSLELWFFGLKQPFFQQYPKTKEDILKERYLTVSELCKMIDEAEWHFWNSHERTLSDDVWKEICEWRLKGPGAEFAIRYFEMIEKETGIPEESIAKLSSEQGKHLNQYKWH